MPSYQDLVRLYTAASDEELAQAHAAGPDAYNADAWRIITDEINRRGVLSTATSPPTPEQVSPPPGTTLSRAGQTGYSQIWAIIAITLAAGAVSVAHALIAFGLPTFVRGLVQFALMVFLAIKLLSGRPWARWLFTAIIGLEGAVKFAATLRAIGSVDSTLIGVAGGISAAILAMTALLALSPHVSAYIAEKSGRLGPPAPVDDEPVGESRKKS